MPRKAGAFGGSAPSSFLTIPLRGGPPGGGIGGGTGPSLGVGSSSRSSSLICMRSARGANFRLKTFSKSSCPLRILTAALASTLPESATTNSWYCSTLPQSMSRVFTAARNVAADISSCSVGISGKSSASIAAPACFCLGVGMLSVGALRGFFGGGSGASSNSSAAWRASRMARCLYLSLRELGRSASYWIGGSFFDTGGGAGASFLGATGGGARFFPLESCWTKRLGCEKAVGRLASGSWSACLCMSSNHVKPSNVHAVSGSSVRQCLLSS
mmetsp:Transcript_16931/g.31621  ORF Transcript_16931/g.31621 Transcript_16931/m.31621 type:complete len:272 (+) Transcript_16931:1135-1950(+)